MRIATVCFLGLLFNVGVAEAGSGDTGASAPIAARPQAPVRTPNRRRSARRRIAKRRRIARRKASRRRTSKRRSTNRLVMQHRAFLDQSAVNTGLSGCLTRSAAPSARVRLQVVVDPSGAAQSVKALSAAGPAQVTGCMAEVVRKARFVRGSARSAFQLSYALALQ